MLGCTHYPFAGEHLRALLGPGVQLVDTGAAVACQTRRQVELALSGAREAAARAGGQVKLFSTGPPHSLQAAASRWLGLSAAVGILSF